MNDLYIANITKTSEFEDEMFQDILDSADGIERERYISAIRTKCSEVGRVREFERMLKQWISAYRSEAYKDHSRKTDFIDASITLYCGNYLADNKVGVIRTDYNKELQAVDHIVCPHPILISERYTNLDTETEKIKIEYYKDGKWKSLIVDNSTILNSRNISYLADRGIMVTSETAKELVKYLFTLLSFNIETIPIYRSINRLGWINNDFAPYCDDVHYDGELEFKSLYNCVKQVGDYETWKNHVLPLAKDFLPIRLMLAVSFASALIDKVGALPFVFHLWGTTGFGKTVSLMIASSVWGNPEVGKLTQSMNQTANSLARKASLLHSICFCADELQQIKDRWGNYDKLIMFLTEGQDRGRAKAHGGVEQVNRWCNSFIFTGEEPITKQNSGGGVKNRVIEVEVKDKIIYDGNATANLLKSNYGFAGREFVETLQQYSNLDDQLKKLYKSFFDDIMLRCDTTDKQAGSMALIMMADELSRNIVWKGQLKELQVSDIRECLSSVNEVDTATRAYNWLINWIAEHNANFIAEGTSEGVPTMCYGKITKDNDLAYINKNVLIQAMTEQGYDFEAVKRKWGENTWIVRNTQGKLMHCTSANGTKFSAVCVQLLTLKNQG